MKIFQKDRYANDVRTLIGGCLALITPLVAAIALVGCATEATIKERTPRSRPLLTSSATGTKTFLNSTEATIPKPLKHLHTKPLMALGENMQAAHTAEKPFRTRKRGGGFLLGIIKPEFPNLWKAAKVQQVVIDHRVTSPRTITYKSRFSRVSRWIAPLTLGLVTYIPYETMNASVAARLNNLMAEEEIYVEKEVSAGFAAEISKSKRFRLANPPEAVFELEITRYALDPLPLSIGRMKPTVSVTGRLFDTNGQLLWIGKGFSTILERGIRGATVEQYEDDPELLLTDFRASVSSAIRRLGAMANVVPRASVTVTPVKAKP